MNVNDRRGLNLGVVLVALGIYFILARSSCTCAGRTDPAPDRNDPPRRLGPAASSAGPIVPAGVLLGLGAGFLLRDPLERWMPGWATLLARPRGGPAARRRRSTATPAGSAGPTPLVPGIVLVTIALVAAVSANLRDPRDPLRDRVEALAVGARGGGRAPGGAAPRAHRRSILRPPSAEVQDLRHRAAAPPPATRDDLRSARKRAVTTRTSSAAAISRVKNPVESRW